MYGQPVNYGHVVNSNGQVVNTGGQAADTSPASTKSQEPGQ
jgi:hypothetical protein